jgi:hypothetical protein
VSASGAAFFRSHVAIENHLEMEVLMVKSSINEGFSITMFDFSVSLGGYGWMMFGRKPSVFGQPSYPHLRQMSNRYRMELSNSFCVINLHFNHVQSTFDGKLVGGLEHFPHIFGIIIPTDFHIFTTNQIFNPLLMVKVLLKSLCLIISMFDVQNSVFDDVCVHFRTSIVDV